MSFDIILVHVSHMFRGPSFLDAVCWDSLQSQMKHLFSEAEGGI